MRSCKRSYLAHLFHRLGAVVLALIAGSVSAPGNGQGNPTPRPGILEDVGRILFYGDSLTDGSSYPDYVVNTLNQLYPDAGFQILNAAGAGDTAADLRRRLATDVLPLAPELVIVCIGTNDCNGRRPPADYRADLEAMIADLRAAGIRIMLVRPSPFGDPDKEARFKQYLAVIDALAGEHGLALADAHGLFVEWMQAGREPLGADGIHHGRDGFEAMARAVLMAMGREDVPMDRTIRPWPGLLTEWETSAPRPRDGNYDPSHATSWKPYDAAALSDRQPWWNAPFPLRGAWMPFDDVNPGAVAYGRTWFDTDTAGDYEIRIGGSPAPQIVWINGHRIWQGRRPNGYHPNADRRVVPLDAGRHEIVAVSNFMVFLGVYPAN